CSKKLPTEHASTARVNIVRDRAGTACVPSFTATLICPRYGSNCLSIVAESSAGLSLCRLIDGNDCGRYASSSRPLMVTPSSRGIDRRIADDRGDQGTEHGTGWS